VYCRHRQSDCRSVINNEAGSRRTMLECCCQKLKKIPKNTNGRLAIPALAGLLVIHIPQFIAVFFSHLGDIQHQRMA